MVNGPEAGGLNCVCVGALLALGVRPADAQAWTAFGPAGQRLLDPLMLAFGLILVLCITFFPVEPGAAVAPATRAIAQDL